MLHYFAYGSNMSHAQMAARCATARFLGAARLRGHRLAFTRRSARWGGGAADIVVDPAAETWGGLYAITEDDLDALDRYEGHPRAYARCRVVVEAPHAIAAWSYAVVDKADGLTPSAAYWQTIVTGAKDCALPGDYVAMLEALRGGAG